MIIKSMGRRKSSKAGQHVFKTLFDYLLHEHSKRDRDHVKIDLVHNIPDELSHEEMVAFFIENAAYLQDRKGANLGYHEILSLPANDYDRAKMKEAIKEIAKMYLEERAPENIAVAMIHEDKDHLHCHIMLSANKLYDKKRLRLSKESFLAVQQNVSSKARQRFPELNIENLYTAENVKSNQQERIRTSRAEQEQPRRKEQSKDPQPKQTPPHKKVELATMMHGLFEQHRTREALEVALKGLGIHLYERGKNMGLVDRDGTKHRFGTLGIVPHFEQWKDRQIQNEKHTEKHHKPQDPNAKNEFLQGEQNSPKRTPTDPPEKAANPSKKSSPKPSLDDELDKRMNDLKTAREQGKARDDEVER